MHTLDEIDAAQLRSDVPDFRPGDTLDVGVRVVEGNRSRVQHFQGVVIRRQGVSSKKPADKGGNDHGEDDGGQRSVASHVKHRNR